MSITGIPNIEIIWGRSNHRFDCAMRITILNVLELRDLSLSLLKYIVSIDFLTKYFENLMLTNLTLWNCVRSRGEWKRGRAIKTFVNHP